MEQIGEQLYASSWENRNVPVTVLPEEDDAIYVKYAVYGFDFKKYLKRGMPDKIELMLMSGVLRKFKRKRRQ